MQGVGFDVGGVGGVGNEGLQQWWWWWDVSVEWDKWDFQSEGGIGVWDRGNGVWKRKGWWGRH